MFASNVGGSGSGLVFSSVGVTGLGLLFCMGGGKVSGEDCCSSSLLLLCIGISHGYSVMFGLGWELGKVSPKSVAHAPA